MQKIPPMVLSIAGFDPSSGAGATADLKTIAAHHCYGLACITALTVQNTQKVHRIEPLDGRLVLETLEELAADFAISAVRIGMLGTSEVAMAVEGFIEHRQPRNIVLDPVMHSSSGAILLGEAGIDVLKKRLLPMVDIVTPNLDEAAALSGLPVTNPAEMKAAALKIQSLGAKNVLVTGGHLPQITDLLLLASGDQHEIEGTRIESNATHGTGCAFASALACNLAMDKDLLESVRAAKKYVAEAIAAAFPLGKGKGPMNHLYRF